VSGKERSEKGGDVDKMGLGVSGAGNKTKAKMRQCAGKKKKKTGLGGP